MLGTGDDLILKRAYSVRTLLTRLYLSVSIGCGAAVWCGAGSAEDINTLSANANCDVVSIKQAAKERGDAEEVDWFALDRQHREHTGQELLPDHTPKEPQRDTVTGCAIRQEGASVKSEPSSSNEADVDELEFVGWAKNAGLDQTTQDQSEDKETNQIDSRTTEQTKEGEQSLLNSLDQSDVAIVQYLLTIGLCILLIAAAFLLRLGYRVAFAIVRRRHVCLIPSKLVADGVLVTGHMDTLGVGAFRFEPDGADQVLYFKQVLAEPTFHYFSVEVADQVLPVFVEGFRGDEAMVVFDKRLSVAEHSELLKHSIIEPKWAQLTAKPITRRRQKKHMKRQSGAKRPAAARSAIKT